MKKATVILANGDFPRVGGEARKLLERADRVVVCDGAAQSYANGFGKAPDIIVGDLDSLDSTLATSGAEIVREQEQETNDLAKAIRLCRARGWNDLVIVGATGKREDHALGNIFRAAEEGIEVVTDYGRFIPVKDEIELEVKPGAAVSVFALAPDTRVVSRGLVWPLDDVKFTNLFIATLNRTNDTRLYLKTTRAILVYICF